jgi:hypothetical protein
MDIIVGVHPWIVFACVCLYKHKSHMVFPMCIITLISFVFDQRKALFSAEHQTKCR